LQIVGGVSVVVALAWLIAWAMRSADKPPRKEK
jgi:hypothetical protein